MTLTFTKEQRSESEVSESSTFLVFRLVNYYFSYLGFIVDWRWVFTSPCAWVIDLFASAINYCLSFIWMAAIGVILPAFIVLFLYFFMLEMA